MVLRSGRKSAFPSFSEAGLLQKLKTSDENAQCGQGWVFLWLENEYVSQEEQACNRPHWIRDGCSLVDALALWALTPVSLVLASIWGRGATQVFVWFNFETLALWLPLATLLFVSTSTRGQEIGSESTPASLMKEFSEKQECNVS